ncbi:MAG TPA: hypothetical protein VFY17_09370, partial [Pilimelia sp.]|nr:hypothetical protein [Pilimelia sp.]
PPKPGGKRRPPHRVTTAVPEVGHLLAWHAGSLFVSARDGVSGAELDLATGRQRSGFPMEAPDPPVAWRPGEAVAGAGFVAVEQLRPGARPGDDDRAYFVAGEPVIVAGPLFDDPAGGLR